jgi:hypothetical protein
MLFRTVLDRLPDGTKKWVRRVYLEFHPRKSLRAYERRQARYEVLNDIWFSGLSDPGEIQDPDSSFVPSLFADRAEFDAYVEEMYESDLTEILDDAIEELPDGRRKELWDIDAQTCERYFSYVRKYEPDVVVETGVHNGVGTLALLVALRMNGTGTLYSISRPDETDPGPPVHFSDEDGYDYVANAHGSRGRPSESEPGSYSVPPGKEPGWIIPPEYHDRWNHYRGVPERCLPEVVDDAGRCDVFVHDSRHAISEMLFEFAFAWEHLTTGGMIFSHHIGWNEAFSTFVQEHDCEFGLVYQHMEQEPEPRYTIPGVAGYIRRPRGAGRATSAGPPDETRGGRSRTEDAFPSQ